MSFTVDRNYGEQSFEIAETALREVGTELAGCSPKVGECYNALSNSVSSARHEVNSAERTIDRVLGDNAIYPVGRYEQASAALAKAQDAVAKRLASAQAAGVMATRLLEDEAMPPVEGDAMLRAEVTDIMSRSKDHTQTLAKLARDPRYAALVASPFGRSLLLERGMDDRTVERAHQLVHSEALGWLLDHGSPTQRAAAARIMAGEKMKVVHLAAASALQMKLEALSAKVRVAGAQAHEPILNVPQKLRQALKR